MKIAFFSKGHRGFTLIELLVVIAIIGILSSVVLASLNTARNRGADAAVKSNLANARAEAELLYDTNTPNSYSGVCGTGANAIGDNVAAAANAGGGTSGCNTSVTNDAWAAWAQLRTSGYYCVDSRGIATTSASSPGTVTACP